MERTDQLLLQDLITRVSVSSIFGGLLAGARKEADRVLNTLSDTPPACYSDAVSEELYGYFQEIHYKVLMLEAALRIHPVLQGASVEAADDYAALQTSHECDPRQLHLLLFAPCEDPKPRQLSLFGPIDFAVSAPVADDFEEAA